MKNTRLNSFNKRVLLKLITVLTSSLTFFNCSEEVSSNLSEYKMEIIESLIHGPDLRIANYDKDSNQYLLSYRLESDLIKFEVRDDNFDILRTGETEGKYFASPNTIEIINDSLKFGTDNYNYYKSDQNLLIKLRSDINRDNNYIRLFNSENTNTTGVFYYSFDDYIRNILETENYYIISAAKETCYFINKTDYQVTSFKNRFIDNYNNGDIYGNGYGIGKDELGRPILSTKKEGVLVYLNNDWQSFWKGELNKYSNVYNQLYLDSKNILYARAYDKIFVFDLNIKKKILTISSSNKIDFTFSKIIGEHTDGSIIILTDHINSNPTNRLLKIKITKN